MMKMKSKWAKLKSMEAKEVPDKENPKETAMEMKKGVRMGAPMKKMSKWAGVKC